jgi:hypothetical protein
MAKPTVKDAELLLQIERLKVSEPMERAFFWFSRELANTEPMTFEQFISKYPRDSESYRNYQLISQFFETVGAIAKHGLINWIFSLIGMGFPFSGRNLGLRRSIRGRKTPRSGLSWARTLNGWRRRTSSGSRGISKR